MPRRNRKPLDGTKPKKEYKGSRGRHQRNDREVRELLAKLAVAIAEEKDPHEICEELEIDYKTFQHYRDKLYDHQKAEITNKTELEVYLEYCNRQVRLIKDLEEMKGEFRGSRQYSALVGAVKAQSEIYDKLIMRGQELGVIRRTPEEVHLVGGVDVRTLSEEDIRIKISNELAKGQKLLKHIDGRKKPVGGVTILGSDRQPKELPEEV